MTKRKPRAKTAAEHAAFARGMRRGAEIARLYADENIRMANDTILLDPILNCQKRAQFTNLAEFEAAAIVSDRLALQGHGHSSRYHAGEDIANMIIAELRSLNRG